MPDDPSQSLPAIKAPAFKEWAVICDLLGNGRQSVILRKGGIAEGRGGFQFRERKFYLFPTLFHEQVARTRLPADTPMPDRRGGEDAVHLRYFVEIDFDTEILDERVLPRLQPFHFWSEQTVAERFDWGRGRSIKLAFVRVHRMEPPWRIGNSPKFGGCKSWVEAIDLPEFPAGGRLLPAISNREHAARREALLAALAPPPAPSAAKRSWATGATTI